MQIIHPGTGMYTNRKDLIRNLLKGIETGDPEALAVVNADRYLQHNPQTPDGRQGLDELFERLTASGLTVNVVRLFEDGDFVFAHVEYDHDSPRVGFEIFRFEDDQAVEHWDNSQPREGPNPSGHSMLDGETGIMELEKTESNRDIVRAFIDEVLINREGEKIYDYVKWNHFVEHNPRGSDDLDGLIMVVAPESIKAEDSIVYEKCHRILADGNFVLSVCEGRFNDKPTAFYDLWCLEHDYIVEHWDTTETIPPVGEWKNDNGKF